jgi:8-oxo-dGTP pyrophosphatase MutT (NUDIX family)
MQQIIQVDVYKLIDGVVHFLVLKRTEADGGFWQPITGTQEPGETDMQTLQRELFEEAGITNPKHISPMVHTYQWTSREGNPGKDNVYAVEAVPDAQVTLSPAEHTDYKWLTLNEAFEILKYEGNKQSLLKASEYITANIA